MVTSLMLCFTATTAGPNRIAGWPRFHVFLMHFGIWDPFIWRHGDVTKSVLYFCHVTCPQVTCLVFVEFPCEYNSIIARKLEKLKNIWRDQPCLLSSAPVRLSFAATGRGLSMYEKVEEASYYISDEFAPHSLQSPVSVPPSASFVAHKLHRPRLFHLIFKCNLIVVVGVTFVCASVTSSLRIPAITCDSLIFGEIRWIRPFIHFFVLLGCSSRHVIVSKE